MPRRDCFIVLSGAPRPNDSPAACSPTDGGHFSSDGNGSFPARWTSRMVTVARCRRLTWASLWPDSHCVWPETRPRAAFPPSAAIDSVGGHLYDGPLAGFFCGCAPPRRVPISSVDSGGCYGGPQTKAVQLAHQPSPLARRQEAQAASDLPPVQPRGALARRLPQLRSLYGTQGGGDGRGLAGVRQLSVVIRSLLLGQVRSRTTDN